MTIRPAALRRRQPAVGSLLIVTIVVPAISRKGAKNQLRRETAYRLYPSICGMDGEGKNRRWLNSGGVLVVAAPAKAAYFRRLGGPAKP
jgi:hypothetical protein